MILDHLMTSISPLSMKLDFLMQGAAERVIEKEKHYLLEHRKGKRETHKSKQVLRWNLKNS